MNQNHNQPQTPYEPQNRPEQTGQSQLSYEDLQQIKSAQTLITIATIGAPVSLIIGGVLLSTISIVCAIVAYMKLKKIMPAGAPQHPLISKVIRSTVLAACFGIGALILNGMTVAMLMPTVMEYVNTGNADALNSMFGGATGGSGSGSSSVWG